MQAVMNDVELACKYHKSVGYDGYLQVTIDGTAVAPVVRLDPDSKVVVGYDDAAEQTTCSTADVARPSTSAWASARPRSTGGSRSRR